MSRRATAVVLGLLLVLAGCTGTPGGVVDGSCGSARSTVTALRADDGSVHWRRTLPHPRDDPPQATRDLVLLRGCGAVVLDASDGRVRHRDGTEAGLVGLAGDYLVWWRDGDVRADPVAGRPGGLVASSQPPYDQVAVRDALVLTGVGTDLTAFDLSAQPRDRWRATLPTLAGATFGLRGDLLAVRAGDGSVYGVDARSGRVAWRALPPAPALGYGTVLAVTEAAVVVAADPAQRREVVALDPATGVERWHLSTAGDRPRLGAGWAASDGVLAAPRRPGVVGIDLATGRQRWTAAVNPDGAVASGDTFVLAGPGEVVAVDARTGRTRWRRATRHQPYLVAVPGSPDVVVLDSPPVPHGYDDCC